MGTVSSGTGKAGGDPVERPATRADLGNSPSPGRATAPTLFRHTDPPTACSGVEAMPITDSVGNRAFAFSVEAATDLDVTEDNQFDGEDALAIYYAYTLGEQLSDDASEASRQLRENLLADLAGGPDRDDAALLEIVRRASVWKEAGAVDALKLTPDETVDEKDWLVLYFGRTLGTLLGDGRTGPPGFAKYREKLLANLAGEDPLGDEALEEMLLKASQVR